MSVFSSPSLSPPCSLRLCAKERTRTSILSVSKLIPSPTPWTTLSPHCSPDLLHNTRLLSLLLFLIMPYLHFGNRQTLICMHVVYQLKKALEWKKSVQAGQCSRAPTRCTNWPPPPLSLFPYILLIPFFLSLLLVFTSLIFDPSASCPFSALAIAFFLSVGLDPFVCMFSTLKPNNRDCFSCFLGRSCRSFLQYTFLAASCFSLSVLMSKMHVYFLPYDPPLFERIGRPRLNEFVAR
ncbi:MAG: hypothetical protein JOS17DRAFT_767451 [Linnemannia elongata]|nr:MAG: hypothetical protein JOS17DRAFT_767451 [Linnemannia elongata]